MHLWATRGHAGCGFRESKKKQEKLIGLALTGLWDSYKNSLKLLSVEMQGVEAREDLFVGPLKPFFTQTL